MKDAFPSSKSWDIIGLNKHIVHWYFYFTMSLSWFSFLLKKALIPCFELLVTFALSRWIDSATVLKESIHVFSNRKLTSCFKRMRLKSILFYVSCRFDRSSYTVDSLQENSAVSAYVTTVEASDSDDDINANIEYSVDPTMGNASSLFDVDPTSGRVFVAQVWTPESFRESLLGFFWTISVLFMGRLIPLFWTSVDDCPRFQSQGAFLPCVFCLIAMDSSGSPLSWHRLTFWWAAFQPSLFCLT